jgi:SAM-dependent methyltransferase
MDLRAYNVDVLAAVSCLDYQPFVISEDVQTGVAYSWVGSTDPRISPQLVFYKNKSPLIWAAAADANARLRAMYDDILNELAKRFPGGTLLDIACNNGYFPIGAELRGMHGIGSDLGSQYAQSINFLNRILGTKAEFWHKPYDSRKHYLPIAGKFDVVVISAIMCHMPDPLHLLKACATIASKAIVFWGQVVITDAKVIAYNSPHASLSSITDFPNGFNDNTRLSLGLFKESAKLLGFSQFITIGPNPTWLTKLHSRVDMSLEDELLNGSRHECLLLVR